MILNKSKRFAALSFIIILSLILCFFQWAIIIPALLGIYCAFAMFDLYKNWNRTKNPVFIEQNEINNHESQKNYKFVYKPDVYILLLESMHSKEAIEKIYGKEVESAENLLKKRDFTIYSNTFSNKHTTPLSLHTILSMSLNYKNRPEVIQQFLHNGYKLYFFDTMYYLSQPYSRYLSNKNAKLARITAILYNFIAPFFAQSRWTRIFCGDIDPFNTEFEMQDVFNMINDLNNHIENDASPSLNIIHFGATHFGDIWYRIPDAEAVYLNAYDNAVTQLDIITSMILNKDKDALIVAVGDHGAYHWAGAHLGAGKPEDNIKDNGIDVEAFVNDYFGVVFGIHWGIIPKPHIDSPISHVNIFRYILNALSGKGKPEHLEEDISILNGKYIIARNGIPLKNFEKNDNKNYSDYYQEAKIDNNLLTGIKNLEKALINKQLNVIDSHAAALTQQVKISRPFTALHFNAGQALLKAGRLAEAAEVWDEYLSALDVFPLEPFINLTELLINLKNYDRALAFVNKALSLPIFYKRSVYFLLMKILWRQNKLEELISVIPKAMSCSRHILVETDQFPMECTLMTASLERVHGWQAAYQWLDEQLKLNNLNQLDQTSLLVNKIMLVLKHDRSNAIKIFSEIMCRDFYPSGIALLFMRELIRTGDLKSASDFKTVISYHKLLQDNSYAFALQKEIEKKGSTEYLRAAEAMAIMSKEINNTSLFNAEYYAAAYSPDDAPILDYIKNGLVLLRNPSPEFDIRFFVCANPLIFLTASEPLLWHTDTGRYYPTSLDMDVYIKNNVHPYFLK